MITLCYLLSFVVLLILLWSLKETYKVLKTSALLLIISFCSCKVTKTTKQTKCWYAKNEQTHYYKHANNSIK